MNINTFKNRIVANKHWIEFLRTPSAKNQLLKYIKTQEREQRLEEAITGLNQYLKEIGLPYFRAEKDKIQKLDEIYELEKRILSVLDKQDTYGNIVRDAYPELLKNVVEKTVLKDSDQQKNDLKNQILPPLQLTPDAVIVDNDKHLSCFFCPECKPSQEHKIIAKSTKLGLKIHALDCKALKTISLDALLEAHWKGQSPNSYLFQLKIKYNPRELTIVDFLQSFSQFNIPLTEMSIKNTDTGAVVVHFLLQLDNPAKASFLLKDLKKYASSVQIIKKMIQ